MKRLSEIILDKVLTIDSFSGYCRNKWTNTEYRDNSMDPLKEICYCNMELFSDFIGNIIEHTIAKPIYHTENLFLDQKKDTPNWNYQ